MRILSKAKNLMVKITFVIGAFCLAMVPAVILLQVIGRWFGITVLWAEEVAKCAFGMATFFGASYVTGKCDHICITLAEELFSGRKKAIYRGIMQVFMTLFCTAVCYSLYVYMKGTGAIVFNTLPQIQIKYYYMILFAASVIMLAVSAITTVQVFTGDPLGPETEGEEGAP